MKYVFDGKGGIKFAIAKITQDKKDPQYIYSEKRLEQIKNCLDERGEKYEVEMLDVPDIDFGDTKFYSPNDVDNFFKIKELEKSNQEIVEIVDMLIIDSLGGAK